MRRLVGVFLIVVAVVATGYAVWMVADGGFAAGFPLVVSLLAVSTWIGGVVSFRSEPAESSNSGESQVRRGTGVVFIALAVVATALFVASLFGALFGNNVGYEVTVVWIITGVSGLFALALWAAGLGLTRHKPDGQSRT